MAKPPTTANTYKSLVGRINQEISQVEFFVKRRTAEGYWKIGRYIHEHLLIHKDRAQYGATLYEKLAKDVDRDPTTLSRTVQFYRAYPILAERQELTWEHYRSLITVKDDKARKALETRIIENDWSSTKLREYLSAKRELVQDPNHPIVQLKFTRGRLHTYQMVKSNPLLAKISPRVLDLGFRMQYLLPTHSVSCVEGDVVELVIKDRNPPVACKSNTSKDEIFTYIARVEKVIDADTFLTSFGFCLDVSLSQKLRLRGIDCPEINTKEGKKAKRFVEARLKGCEFIIVKTYKDRSDKFDRYLADVFYKAGESDPHVVAQEGTYLNQELLNERLAVIFK